MGFGAALAPGGNDVLLLHSIPMLSAHALPVYGSMIAGIALVLVGMRWLSGVTMRVDCGGDSCAARERP
jgi:hypothetical protein